MADAPTVTQSPNRALGIILLLLTALGTLVFTAWGIWLLFEEDRLGGTGYLSLGIGWFLFFSWVFRSQQRPWRPTK